MQGNPMSRQLFLTCSLTLALAPLTGMAAEEDAVRVSGGEDNAHIDYLGDRTRIGISVDDSGEFSGELLKVFAEDEDSAVIAEGWFGSGSGGVKLNYHWLADDADRVYKLFAAMDQNDTDDRKATVGVGLENQSLFFAGYLSQATTSEREVGRTLDIQQDLLTGNDSVGAWQQTQTTSLLTRRFAQAYDKGVGLRLGRYMEDGLWRARIGADYEWGDYNSDQWTYSLGVEKFIAGTGHSFALNVEHAERSGDFEEENSDTRGMLTWRYAFGDTYHNTRSTVRTQVNVSPMATATTETPDVRHIVKNQVDMQSDAYFNLDSAILREEHLDDIRKIADALAQQRLVGKISLVGHTCDLGTEIYNQGLSERRAMAVRERLIQFGVPADRILTEGRGESQPLFTNDGEANRSRNRRVDIHFLQLNEADEALPVREPIEHTEWRTEIVEQPSAWRKRALVNPISHKRRVDVYHFEKSETTVTIGDKEYTNRLPTAQDDTATAYRNGASVLIDVLTNDGDEDGDELTITAVTQPTSGGTVENFGNLVSFTPAAGFNGETEFSYTVDDGQGGQANATVRVTVTNNAPTLVSDSATTDLNQPVTIDVLANDSDLDGDTLELTAVSVPPHGSAVIEGGQVHYQPAEGYFGNDAFTYTATDSAGSSSIGTVTITILERTNAAPNAVDDRLVTPYLSAITVDVLKNDSDPDGDPLSVTGFEGLPPESVGTYQINSDNTVTFRPIGWDGLSITVTYLISDGHGGTDSALLTIIDP